MLVFQTLKKIIKYLVRGLAAARKNMSAFDIAVQQEHVTDKEYIGTLLAQIKAQQETYNILYKRNWVLYNEFASGEAEETLS